MFNHTETETVGNKGGSKMAVSDQDINELLASGKSSNEIKNADKYLKSGTGSKPDWLEDFLGSNKSKLTETILRAISSSDGMTSMSGYNEGYFNEIIQNANDLNAGETIDINVSTDGTKYSVNCIYQDAGFSVSNIYGFLNREMSDKSSEEGQTGKFGVGIKSFFKFVSKFKIESNVIFEFIVDKANLEVSSNVYLNDDWDHKNTVLSFEYSESETGENVFNTRKLSNLIDYLEKDSEDDISKFFFDGEDNELVFDICSLIFMNKNSNKKTISQMNFCGSCHSVSIVYKENCDVQEIEKESEKWKIADVLLSISVDGKEKNSDKYIVFTKGKMSIGFPLYFEMTECNRFYSTYYIKKENNDNILSLSMIINTESANIHRNDIGDNEESIKEVYEKVKEYLKELYCFMCSSEITAAKCITDISDIFHSVLYRYYEDDESIKESPFNLDELDNQYLPKIINNSKTDIVVHKEIENYQKSTPLDKNSVIELEETYFEYIEKGNVLDYNELINSQECIYGVNKIYKYLYEESEKDKDNYKIAIKMLHFFPRVDDYITYVVTGYRDKDSISDLEVDKWLIELKSLIGESFNQNVFLKLIGRYSLNPALDFDGSLIKDKLSFKDYLFNGIPEYKDGIMSNWQNKQYDSKYAELKRQVCANRLMDNGNVRNKYKIRYMRPKSYSRRGWKGIYDCYGYTFNDNSSQVSNKNKFMLLEKIAFNGELIDKLGYLDYSLCLYEKKAIELQCRDNSFMYYSEQEQQIICLDFLNTILLMDFGEFLQAIYYRKRIRDYRGVFNINIKCINNDITTNDILNRLLPYIIDQDEEKKSLMTEYKPQDVYIGTIQENTNNELPDENINFIYRISGYKLFVSKFNSNSKKYMISYFGNRMAAIKTEAKGAFKQIATYNSQKDDIFIFYDNVPDIQTVVAIVLKELNLSKNIMDFLMGYIHNGNNTKTMNYLSRRRTFAKVKKKLVLDWNDIELENNDELEDNEVIYRLLTARGSYDIYCHICSDIPLETFDYGEDTKRKHSRKIIVMENENSETKDEFPYIITIGCSYCFEKLRNTLSKSEFDGKNLTLTTQISQGQHERMKIRHQIELSPINIQIMKKIRFRRNEELEKQV